VPSAIEQLHWAEFFTKLDLLALYLIRFREGDEWKTSFGTISGHYKYLVRPFGSTNAPSMFQAFINVVFRDMLGHQVIVYVDDILIYWLIWSITSRTFNLERLLTHHLYVTAEKCKFHHRSVSFLG
jgi:hypothetical protein